MTETILLTGAAGFIGSHLAERFLAAGHRVVGVDNFDPFYDPAEKRANLAAAHARPEFRLVEEDCADLPALERAVGEEAFDVVVHLAAKAGVRPSIADPMAYARANLTATQALLELARRRGIRRFVFGSSSSVYGNNEKVPFSEDDPVDRPISPYAATKRGGELLCHTYHHLHDLTVLALRFFTVYGPRQRPDLAIRKFSTLMLRGEEIPMFGDGSTERDYTWIDDIIDGVVAAAARTREHPGEFEIINLGESRTTELRRLIALLAEALDVEPRIRRLPMQPGDVLRTFADVTRARDLLGYRPTTPVEEGIPRFARWIRQHQGSNAASTPSPS
ncbi:MAG TPA: NAD-dependent epimerase/dehydratase family protein [Longimicrobiales bacterium]|nr:NAD-dependent epimerase/dehydratase family protein [Longimicrobiales bacterium]